MIILIRPSIIHDEKARLKNKYLYYEVLYISNNYRKTTAIIVAGSRHSPNIKK